MDITNDTTRCDFCDRLHGDCANRSWYDFRIIQETPSFVVVPAVGSLAPAHVMIVTRQHIERMADLTETELEALESLCDSLADEIRASWRVEQVTLFEHGGRSQTSSQSCINHAHVQLMAGRIDIEPTVGESIEIGRLTELAQFANLDYVLVGDDATLRAWRFRPPAGQFLRRLICARTNVPDEWDYLVYPHLERVRETIDRLGSKR